MNRGRLRTACLAFALGLPPLGGASAAPGLGFEERVAAERAIAGVYLAHQLEDRRPFDVAVSPGVLEQRVRRSLGQSAALASYWGAPIRGEALHAEMRRIARDTRFPDRLREIYEALGNDPVTVEETLARRTLADRWARAYFARDKRIHLATLREAEALRRRLTDGSLPLLADDPRRYVTELSRVAARDAAARRDDDVELLSERRIRRRVTEDEFARLRALAPAAVGDIGPLIEEDDRFLFRVATAEGVDRATLSVYVVPKTTWDDWWSETGPAFESSAVPTVAEAASGLPEPRTASGPPTCAPSDTWDNGGLGEVPDGRTSAAAVWTGSAMVVWGGYREGVYPVTGGRYDPITDTWSRTSSVNAPVGRTGHSMVWTGNRVAVWGGVTVGGQLASGALYDPAADAWTAMATSGAPGARQNHSAIWTGSAMVVWGGYFADISGGHWLQTGGRYDPSANTWLPTSTPNAPAGRQYHSAVWTGSRMIVWGGRISGAGDVVQTGGRYDPAADSWSPTSLVGAPAARELHTAVSGGGAMIVWGGHDYVLGSPHPFASGARYNPETDSWLALPTAGAPPARQGHTAVWTGNEMIVWGGNAGTTYFDGGAIYRPETGSWASMASAGAPYPRTDHVAVWSGRELLVWAGYGSGSNYFESGGRYDPARDLWAPTYWMNPPAPRHGATAIWTGNMLIVWGGLNVDTPLATGGRYDPLTDAWSPTATAGVSRIRTSHTAVWSGSEMLVWGGEPCPATHDYGGRYDPVADTWQPIAYTSEPLFRRHHTAVWTGSKMLVWGGLTCETATSVTDSGALYDPVANVWTASSTTGAPTPREEHTAVWTGGEMLVWGGRDAATPVKYANTGGRYDPLSGVWTAMTKPGAPAGRSLHTAVWTGSKMIVWGGTGGVDFDSGGIYDPATNGWSATATTGAPSARIGHSAVWTGSAMLVWGGETSAAGIDSLATGARYDPAANTWAPTSIAKAPSARHDHVGAWLSTFMAVWGGMGEYEVDSGGRYVIDNPDGDADGVADVCDCAPGNPTVFAIPGSVTGLEFATDKTSLSWSSAAASSGTGTVYDLVRGGLAELPVGAGGSETCLASNASSATAQDVANPPVGSGFWYLVRARNLCGRGIYGRATGGAEEVSTVCP